MEGVFMKEIKKWRNLTVLLNLYYLILCFLDIISSLFALN